MIAARYIRVRIFYYSIKGSSIKYRYMTDKNRKWIYKPNRIVMLLLYLLLPTAAYLSAVLYLYNSEKHNIESEANRFFLREAPYWCDSIRTVKKMKITIPEIYTDEYKTDRCSKYRVISDYHGNCTVPGKHIYEKSYLQHKMKQSNIELVSQGLYDIAVADSLWNNQLRRNGIDVETALILIKKELREVFPTKDSLNADATAVSDTSRTMDFDAAFRTDTARISHIDLVSVVGFVDVPFALIFSRLGIILILLTVIFAVYLLFMLFRGIVWLYVENINKEIIFIGDAFVLLNEKVVLCSNGERKNLSGNELIILQMLIESKGYVKIHDIIATCWKGHMEESGRKSFNVAFSALNKALTDVAHVSLKREKNEIMCIENCNILNRFMRELRLILHIVK